MASQTTNLKLPYLAAAQAQKHVTLNESLRMLDAIVQLSVVSRSLQAPPAAPAEGQRYIVPADATAAWLNQQSKVAVWQDGIWAMLVPLTGWMAWVADEGRLCAFNGANWVDGANLSINPVEMVGVNASAVAGERLVVKSNSVLLSHDETATGTGSVRAKLNKLNTAATASLIFQNGYSGRAEFGLAGDDKFRIKTSANGTNWTEALTIDNTNARVGVNQPAPQVELDVNGSIRLTGTLNLADAHQKVTGNVGNYPSTSYYRNGDSGRSLAFGFDPSVRSLFINRWNYANDSYVANVMQITNDGFVTFFSTPRPAADNNVTCGTSTARWSVVYSATGTINTSDARLKTDIQECPLGLDFIRALAPKLYRWVEGGTEISYDTPQPEDSAPPTSHARTRPGRRLHAGFMAQEVKAALEASGADCALWVIDDPARAGSLQSLRYDQFIAPIVRAVQELAQRVEILESCQKPG